MSRNEHDKKAKLTNRNLPLFMGIAAGAIMVFILGISKPGMEAIAKVKEVFVPQKKVLQQIEGEKEQHEVNLKKNTKGYIIYMDDSYFTIEHLNGSDKITPKNKLNDSNFPELYMEIKEVSNKKPSDLFYTIEKQLKSQYKYVNSTGKVVQPLEALRISATSDKKSNSKEVVNYIVDNKKGGSFLITQQLFIEAEEGMGVRFNNILKEFKLTE